MLCDKFFGTFKSWHFEWDELVYYNYELKINLAMLEVMFYFSNLYLE